MDGGEGKHRAKPPPTPITDRIGLSVGSLTRNLPTGEHLSAELSPPYFMANFISEHHPSFWRIDDTLFFTESSAEIP